MIDVWSEIKQIYFHDFKTQGVKKFNSTYILSQEKEQTVAATKFYDFRRGNESQHFYGDNERHKMERQSTPSLHFSSGLFSIFVFRESFFFKAGNIDKNEF